MHEHPSIWDLRNYHYPILIYCCNQVNDSSFMIIKWKMFMERSIYIQKKNSKILFACMCSWFFSMSELGFFLAINCTCGTLVKNMIYRRQCTQKSPRHNIGKKIYQLLPKKLLKIFFRLDLIMDYYNIQVYNGTSLSFYYPGNFIWWEIIKFPTTITLNKKSFSDSNFIQLESILQ